MNINDQQWEIISKLVPLPKSASGKKSRPARDQREVLNGVFWICRIGAQWNETPDKYPPIKHATAIFKSGQRQVCGIKSFGK